MKIKTDMTRWTIAALTGFSLILAVSCGPSNVELEVVADGFNSPTVLTHPGDGSDRLFVADQIGKIYVIVNGTLQQDPFLDISAKIAALLGAYVYFTGIPTVHPCLHIRGFRHRLFAILIGPAHISTPCSADNQTNWLRQQYSRYGLEYL